MFQIVICRFCATCFHFLTQAFNNSPELSCDVKTLLQKCKQYMILIVSFDLERLKKDRLVLSLLVRGIDVILEISYLCHWIFFFKIPQPP